MIYRAHELQGEPREYDLCIIGSGPAGLAVVAELSSTPLSICVLESGDRVPSVAAEELRIVESEGLEVKARLRERVFGGSSRTWDHLAAPLDSVDFERRPCAHHEGWPITRTVLDQYYARAACYFRFPNEEEFTQFTERSHVEKLHPKWQQLAEKAFLSPRMPARFAKEFASLFAIPNKDLYLGATVVELFSHPSAEGRNITGASVKLDDGHMLRFTAKQFILAASGIDTPRLLLASKDESGIGLGNAHDQVGRYLMNHPKGYAGRVRFARPVAKYSSYFDRYGRKETQNYIGLRLTDEAQYTQNVLNAYVHLVPEYPWSHKRGIEALRSLIINLRFVLRPLRGGQISDAVTRVPNVMHDAVRVLVYSPQILFYAFVRVWYTVRPGVRTARLRNHLEMEPDPENRVMLSQQKDRLGVPIAIVRQQVSPYALDSLRALHAQLGEELVTCGVGELEVKEDLATAIVEEAGHYLGATRMGRDPETSVVNPNLRVHGVSNLYIAGGSVFPTSGNANPTFTIMALSLRVADHLKDEVFHVPTREATVLPEAKEMLIIGAGLRVVDDVIPAIEANEELSIRRIYASSERTVFGARGAYSVAPLDRLTADDVQAAAIAYIAVPTSAVDGVLRALLAKGGTHLTLVIDTPAPLETGRVLYSQFARVCVAEDSGFLPWIAPLADAVRSRDAQLTHIAFDRSVFRYHGLALSRAIDYALENTGHITYGYYWGTTMRFFLASGLAVRITEPRDYAHGTIRFFVYKGSRQEELAVQILQEDGYCTGFRVEDSTASLSEAERLLIGIIRPRETIVTAMMRIKRVGLYRLIRDVAAGGPGWKPSDAEQDVRIDQILHRFGIWFA